MPLLIAFILIPLIEIGLFIQIGGWLTLWPTLGLVVLTAFIGASLVRNQGLAKLREIQGTFDRLEDPREPLAHGVLILVAGALLLTPGFFTDAVGFSLLVPCIRTAVLRWAGAYIQTKMASNVPNQPDTIDGTFEDLDDRPQSSGKPSGWTRH